MEFGFGNRVDLARSEFQTAQPNPPAPKQQRNQGRTWSSRQLEAGGFQHFFENRQPFLHMAAHEQLRASALLKFECARCEIVSSRKMSACLSLVGRFQKLSGSVCRPAGVS